MSSVSPLSVTGEGPAPLRREPEPRERPNLARRYGAIGIPAVVAAARYHVAARNPTYAPAQQSILQDSAAD